MSIFLGVLCVPCFWRQGKKLWLDLCLNDAQLLPLPTYIVFCFVFSFPLLFRSTSPLAHILHYD